MNSTRRGDLRRAFDIDLAFGAVAENGGIAQHQRVVGDAAVLLAVALDLRAQVGAHGFQRPADVVAVQMRGDAVEILLAESCAPGESVCRASVRRR